MRERHAGELGRARARVDDSARREHPLNDRRVVIVHPVLHDERAVGIAPSRVGLFVLDPDQNAFERARGLALSGISLFGHSRLLDGFIEIGIGECPDPRFDALGLLENRLRQLDRRERARSKCR